MIAKLGFGFNDGFTFPKIVLPHLFQVGKELNSDAFFQFVSQSYRVCVSGESKLAFPCVFHTYTGAFSLFKSFLKILVGNEEVPEELQA